MNFMDFMDFMAELTKLETDTHGDILRQPSIQTHAGLIKTR